MSPGQFLGYLSLITAQVMIGINVIVGKFLIEHMPIYLFLCLRFFVSAFGLTMFFMLTRRIWVSPYHPTGKLEKYDWLMMIAQGLCGGFGFNFLFFWGLDYTTAMSAGIIGASLPVIIAISAFFFLKEKMNLAMGFALVFAMLGVMVIGLNNPHAIEGDSHGSFLGDFLILLAMFPEAWYSIIGKAVANRLRPLAAAVIANWVTVLCFLPMAVYQGMDYNWHQLNLFYITLICIGGLSSLLFFWLWPWGLKYVSATRASLYGGLMPISTCVLAYFFLNERFHPLEAVGMVLIFISLWLGSQYGADFVGKLVRVGRRSKS